MRKPLSEKSGFIHRDEPVMRKQEARHNKHRSQQVRNSTYDPVKRISMVVNGDRLDDQHTKPKPACDRMEMSVSVYWGERL
jgi:hypothetical protein